MALLDTYIVTVAKNFPDDAGVQVMRAYSGREGLRFLGGAYSFVACLSHLTIDYEPLSRRSTVPSTVPTYS